MAIEGRTHRPVIDHKKCNVCSVCFHACPAGIMPEMRSEDESLRGKIYSASYNETGIETGGVLDLPPCQLSCPLGQDVRGYIKLIGERRYREALELVRETNPLPSVCGYVCHHPCEAACTRSLVDDALSIKSLKLFLTNYYDNKLRPPKRAKAKGIKVAIVGAGPAGLTAAHELNSLGYKVEITESYPEPGGMLAWAIPGFRLPREVLKRDIEYIKNMGVTIKTGVCFGTDIMISDLRNGGAKAIIIAAGTQQSLKMNIENENDSEGYLDCLTFLKRCADNEQIDLGEKVLVLGGGNAAIDTARSALRLGARNVTVLYRRGPEEMPADGDEVKEALIEGVKIEFLTDPVKLIVQAGRIFGLECVKTELHEVPGSGRRRPVIIAGSEFIIYADTIIPAIGQEPDEKLKKALKVDNKNKLGVLDGIFLAGDFINGPTTVVEAMASGKKVAREVDVYLSNKDPGPEGPALGCPSKGLYPSITDGT